MNRPLFVCVFLILGGILCAQTGPEWLWAKRAGGSSSYADEGKAIALDSSGNIFMTDAFYGTASFGSTTLTSCGVRDIFIA